MLHFWIENVVPLVRPAAQHVGVRLDWSPPADACRVRGNAEDLEQVIVNLLLNAVEAAAGPDGPHAEALVAVALSKEQEGSRDQPSDP